MQPEHFDIEKYLETSEFNGERARRINEGLVSQDYGGDAKTILESLSNFLALHHLFNGEVDEEDAPTETQKLEYVAQMMPLWDVFRRFNINPYAILDLKHPEDRQNIPGSFI